MKHLLSSSRDQMCAFVAPFSRPVFRNHPLRRRPRCGSLRETAFLGSLQPLQARHILLTMDKAKNLPDASEANSGAADRTVDEIADRIAKLGTDDASTVSPQTSNPTTSASENLSMSAASDVETKASSSVAATRRVRIIYSDRFLEHKARVGHPERPERLRACVRALKDDSDLADSIEWVEPTPVDEGSDRRKLVLDLVTTVHTFPDYLHDLEKLSKGSGGMIDSDTYVAPGSYEIALLAVSAWVDAVDFALAEDGGCAFALTRPPGHHASRVTGQGFCLLSNAAIGAYYALRSVERVGILDFDVHHGNGTEHAVETEPRIRFTSSHQVPLYPGSGDPSVVGPHNTILNIALNEGTDYQRYQDALEKKMLPHALFESDPEGRADLLLVSAGYDVLDVDPLAGLKFKASDFTQLTTALLEGCKRISGHQRIAFGLEGGYNTGPDGIGTAVRHTVETLLRK